MEIQSEEQINSQDQKEVQKSKILKQKKNGYLPIMLTTSNSMNKNKTHEMIDISSNTNKEYNFFYEMIELCKPADYQSMECRKTDKSHINQNFELKKKRQSRQSKQLVRKFKQQNEHIQAQILMYALKYYSQKKVQQYRNATINEDRFQGILGQIICLFIQKNWRSKHFIIQEVLLKAPYQVNFYLSILKGLSKNKKNQNQTNQSNQLQLNSDLKKYCNDLFTHILINFRQKIKTNNFILNFQKIISNNSSIEIQIINKLFFITEAYQLILFDECSYNQVLQEISVIFSQNFVFIDQQSTYSSNELKSYVWQLYIQSVQLLIESYKILNLNSLQQVQEFIDTILKKCNFWNVVHFLYEKRTELLKIFIVIQKLLNNNSKNNLFSQQMSIIIKKIYFQPSIQFMEIFAQYFNAINQDRKQIMVNFYESKQDDLLQYNCISQKFCQILQKEIKNFENSIIDFQKLMKQSILNAFFSQLRENSIFYMFKLLKSYQKYQSKRICLQQIVFAIFLINQQTKNIICQNEQLLLQIQAFLFQVLRNQSNSYNNFNNFSMKIVFFIVLVQYFDKVSLSQYQRQNQNQSNFKEQSIIQIAVNYPQLLKNHVFNQSNNSHYDTNKNDLKQKCFYKIIQNNPQIHLIQKIIYYLRKFQNKVKTLFIKFLYQKIQIDIYQYSQFQSLSWHLIQSNVPIGNQRISYIYENFLLKNPLKFAQCLNGFKLTTLQNEKNFYNNLLNLYIQNCLLSSQKGQIKIPVSRVIVEYINHNIKEIIKYFFDTSQPLKLHCQLMKYYLRCIYQNIQIQVIFFVALQTIFQFCLKFQIFIQNFYLLDTNDAKEFQLMINQWKKVVEFYQKRKFSKYILFTIFIAQINFLNIFQNFNKNSYKQKNMMATTPFRQKLTQIYLKHKSFIINSLLSWFQDQSTKEEEKIPKNKQKNQNEEIMYQLSQKILICSCLFIVQKQFNVITNQLSFQMNENGDQLLDLWGSVKQNFKNTIQKHQKQFAKSSNQENQYKTFKRQKQQYQEDDQEQEKGKEYCSSIGKKFNRSKQNKSKYKRNCPVISIQSKQRQIRNEILTNESILMNEFQLFKQIQQKMTTFQSTSNYGLVQNFQKSMNLSDIVKVQKKFRNILHVKKY